MPFNIQPSHHILCVDNFTPEAIREEKPAIQAVMFAVSSLTNRHAPEISETRLDVLRGLQDSGYDIGLVSNAQSAEGIERAHELAAVVKKEVGWKIGLVVAGEDGNRPMPHPQMFKRAARQAGWLASETAHVGDQMLKDVRGARLAGYGMTILVAASSARDEDGRVRTQLPLEATLRIGLGLSVLGRDFPKTLQRPYWMDAQATNRDTSIRTA